MNLPRSFWIHSQCVHLLKEVFVFLNFCYIRFMTEKFLEGDDDFETPDLDM